MEEKAITLEELLASRDSRRDRQQQLLADSRGLTLVVLTIVMPGSVKRNRRSLVAAEAAVKALCDRFDGHISLFEERDLPTGFEAFILTDLGRDEAKRLACGIEDTHPLGRLFDIDVIAPDGVPVSRTTLGLPQRRCLVCGDDARVCMRLNRHSYDDLLRTIASMIESYERKNV